MGRPLGATNKDKPFRAALVRALGIADNNPEKLDKLAAALLARAQEGEVAALREVADRLDGKVPQGLEHSGDAPRPVAIITGVERGAPINDVSPEEADASDNVSGSKH
jgi:hypothetical protein